MQDTCWPHGLTRGLRQALAGQLIAGAAFGAEPGARLANATSPQELVVEVGPVTMLAREGWNRTGASAQVPIPVAAMLYRFRVDVLDAVGRPLTGATLADLPRRGWRG